MVSVRKRGKVYEYRFEIATVVIAIFILSNIILIPFYNKNMQIYKKFNSQ